MMSDEKMVADVDDGCMDWDTPIENDGQEFVVLPDGTYPFYVEKLDKAWYPGSKKIPPCNKATLSLRVQGDDGKIAYVRTDLILYKSLEWKLAGFFRSIGQKKHGEKLVPKWDEVVGSTGRAKITTRTFTGKDGKEHETNDVDSFVDPETDDAPAPTVFGTFTEVTEEDPQLPF